MKKKLIMGVAVVMMLGALAGCTSKESPSPEVATSEATSEEPTAEASDAPAEETPAASEAPVEDAVAAASEKESSDPADLVAAMSADGSWIFAITDNVTLTEELKVDGEFRSKDDPAGDIYRKLALYAQDADKNVTASYTLTVPNIVVNSPNFRIQNGAVVGNITANAEGFTLKGTTFTGDIIVNANGFVLDEAIVEGDITFASEEFKTSAVLDGGTITGEVKVG